MFSPLRLGYLAKRFRTIMLSVRGLLRVRPCAGLPHLVCGCPPRGVRPSPPPWGWSRGFITDPRTVGGEYRASGCGLPCPGGCFRDRCYRLGRWSPCSQCECGALRPTAYGFASRSHHAPSTAPTHLRCGLAAHHAQPVARCCGSGCPAGWSEWAACCRRALPRRCRP